MPVSNAEIAAIFTLVADLLEIQGENPFRVRAYRTAARTVPDLPRSAAQMVGEGAELSELPGIGKDLAAKIRQAVERGTVDLLEELQRKMPGELGRLLEVSGLGPKRVQVLWKQLGITRSKSWRPPRTPERSGCSRVRREDRECDQEGSRPGHRGRWAHHPAVADEAMRLLLRRPEAVPGVKRSALRKPQARERDRGRPGHLAPATILRP
jgi:hypothetical protein